MGVCEEDSIFCLLDDDSKADKTIFNFLMKSTTWIRFGVEKSDCKDQKAWYKLYLSSSETDFT